MQPNSISNSEKDTITLNPIEICRNPKFISHLNSYGTDFTLLLKDPEFVNCSSNFLFLCYREFMREKIKFTHEKSTEQNRVHELIKIFKQQEKFKAEVAYQGGKRILGIEDIKVDNIKLPFLLKDLEFRVKQQLNYIKDLYHEMYKIGAIDTDFLEKDMKEKILEINTEPSILTIVNNYSLSNTTKDSNTENNSDKIKDRIMNIATLNTNSVGTIETIDKSNSITKTSTNMNRLKENSRPQNSTVNKNNNNIGKASSSTIANTKQTITQDNQTSSTLKKQTIQQNKTRSKSQLAPSKINSKSENEMFNRIVAENAFNKNCESEEDQSVVTLSDSNSKKEISEEAEVLVNSSINSQSTMEKESTTNPNINSVTEISIDQSDGLTETQLQSNVTSNLSSQEQDSKQNISSTVQSNHSSVTTNTIEKESKQPTSSTPQSSDSSVTTNTVQNQPKQPTSSPAQSNDKPTVTPAPSTIENQSKQATSSTTQSNDKPIVTPAPNAVQNQFQVDQKINLKSPESNLNPKSFEMFKSQLSNLSTFPNSSNLIKSNVNTDDSLIISNPVVQNFIRPKESNTPQQSNSSRLCQNESKSAIKDSSVNSFSQNFTTPSSSKTAEKHLEVPLTQPEISNSKFTDENSSLSDIQIIREDIIEKHHSPAAVTNNSITEETSNSIIVLNSENHSAVSLKANILSKFSDYAEFSEDMLGVGKGESLNCNKIEETDGSEQQAKKFKKAEDTIGDSQHSNNFQLDLNSLKRRPGPRICIPTSSPIKKVENQKLEEENNCDNKAAVNNTGNKDSNSKTEMNSSISKDSDSKSEMNNTVNKDSDSKSEVNNTIESKDSVNTIIPASVEVENNNGSAEVNSTQNRTTTITENKINTNSDPSSSVKNTNDDNSETFKNQLSFYLSKSRF